jgi:hypothetical protein
MTSVAGTLSQLRLRLDCDGLGASAQRGPVCGAGNIDSNRKVVTTTLSNTTVIPLSNVSGIEVGSLAQQDAFTPPGTWVTAVDPVAKTVTLSNPINTHRGNALAFLNQGSLTFSLYDSSGPLGTANAITSVPGTALASFSLYDMQLYEQNPAVASSPQLFSFSNPFGSIQLSANTPYWIVLSSGGAANNDTPTNFQWDAVRGAAGTGTAGQYFNLGIDNSPLRCYEVGGLGSSPTDAPPACSFLDGAALAASPGLSFAMSVTVDAQNGPPVHAPEPGTLALLGGALALFGTFALRRRKTNREQAQKSA